MGLLQKVISGMRKGQEDLVKPDLPDDVTTDKVLRGLRRERRIQMEKEEKKYLRQKIADYNKNESRKYLWGITGKQSKAPGFAPKGKIKGNTAVFSDKAFRSTRRAKKAPKKDSMRFMGKTKI